MSENHCKDCCCARIWEALGVTAYTGKSIVEHIEGLRAQVDHLTSERARVGRMFDSAFERLKQAEARVEALNGMLARCRDNVSIAMFAAIAEGEPEIGKSARVLLGDIDAALTPGGGHAE